MDHLLKRRQERVQMDLQFDPFPPDEDMPAPGAHRYERIDGFKQIP